MRDGKEEAKRKRNFLIWQSTKVSCYFLCQAERRTQEKKKKMTWKSIKERGLHQSMNSTRIAKIEGGREENTKWKMKTKHHWRRNKFKSRFVKREHTQPYVKYTPSDRAQRKKFCRIKMSWKLLDFKILRIFSN